MNKNNKLPSFWDMTAKFQQAYPYLIFCKINKCFFQYQSNKLLWVTLEIEEVQSLFIGWLIKTFPTQYKTWKPTTFSEILMLLKRTNFSMPDAKTEANKKGFLLPFKNGVLNCNTLVLIPHKAELYCTHIVPVEWNFDRDIQGIGIQDRDIQDSFLPMIKFLRELVNHSPTALNCMRACLYLIFKNITKHQICLYLYGPGGTGKSTLTNILLFLFGSSASLSASYRTISSRFGSDLIRDKLLLVINEIPPMSGSEPSFLKSIIGGDPITGEQKYRTALQFIPKVFVIITGNSIWNFKDASTAMARRMLYFPCQTRPECRDDDLFNVTGAGLAEGKLVEALPSLIYWALTCPEEYLSIISEGAEKATECLSPDSQLRTNPIKVWALEQLEEYPKGQIRIGNSADDKETLYGSYVNWASDYKAEVGTVRVNQFGTLLLDILLALNWKVCRKRIAKGSVIAGIRFKSEPSPTMYTSAVSVLPKNLDFEIYYQRGTHPMNRTVPIFMPEKKKKAATAGG